MTPDEVKQARARLQCTAKELAAALDVEPSTIASWERGETFPTKKHVDQMTALVEKGPTAIARKSKGSDPIEALRDPDVWTLVRKILRHPKLRAEIAKLADRYDDE